MDRYNTIVARIILLLSLFVLSATALLSQEVSEPPLPPEEDETFAEPREEYGFNPLQAEKEYKVGRFYEKKGSYRAAAMRFEEALKWNEAFPEAWWRLAEAREELRQFGAARKAYQKFLEFADEDDGDRKKAQEKLKKLPKEEDEDPLKKGSGKIDPREIFKQP
jgi:tetratricopeptide (TPR) repeat protein